MWTELYLYVDFNLWGHDPKATRYYEANPQGSKQ